MQDFSANIQGRVFPTIDFMNAGIHTGKHGNNQIDQQAFAAGLRHAADLVAAGTIAALGGSATVEGYAGSKRVLTVVSKYVLPD